MQARQLPAHRGWAWLRDGMLLWRRNPTLLTFAGFGYLLMLLLISVVPIIGLPIASLLMPVFALGVLNACRAVDEGRKVGPDVLFSGFQHNLQSLVTIGGVYLIGRLLVLLASSLADGGVLFHMMTGGAETDPEATAQPGFTFGLMLAIALSVPVMMTYWFAPILAGWWKLSAPKAMFFSFVACVRNWRPFLAYAMALLIFCMILPGIVIGIVGLVLPALATLLSVVLVLVLVPVVFASFYTNARDVFGVNQDEEVVTVA